MTPNTPMRVLLLCNYDPFNAAMVSDHINALHLYSQHEVVVFPSLVAYHGNLPDDIALDLFDAVIVHYSLFLAVDAYVSAKTRHKLQRFSGVKAIFLQDEYRFVEESLARIRDVGFDIIFTCVPENSIELVYPADALPGVQRVNVLTGYVPASLLSYAPIPLTKRRYDVSYRGRKYPAWHGSLGLEKWKIAEKFKRDAWRYGLKTNISFRERDRVYGRDWVALLQNSRAVLGVESGASVFDFTGGISARVETVAALLSKKDASYEALRTRYFADMEGKIPLEQISPRIFEAIALRTLCILYEGDYSGILVPWRHYVPLRKDHSNMDEVVAFLKDPWKVGEVVADAYSEVAMNPEYSYERFVSRIDQILSATREQKQCPLLTSASDRDDAEIDAELLRLQKAYPFYCVRNPHGLQVSGTTWLGRLGGIVRRIVPLHWLRAIRNAVR